jgi:hypothetical protein
VTKAERLARKQLNPRNDSSICECQYCGDAFHIKDGLDPCAFCDDCKDAVLDLFAKHITKVQP